MMEKGNQILSVDSLCIGYRTGWKVNILHPALSASASEGELIAVIGRNGIGKSTFLRTIVSLQKSFGGSIKIRGREIGTIPPLDLARLTGYISTEIIRVSNMTVYDLVALGRFPHTNWIGKIDPASREAIEDALKDTGLENFSDRYVSELSDGERQRAMIARILAQNTDILIMDEPTAFLDIAGKYDIAFLLKKLSGAGKTIIFSTHDLYIALNLADRIWLMMKNGIVEGRPEEMVRNSSFDNLFESSGIKFDPVTGRFDRKDVKGDHLRYFL
jgi:iron complex transport system ATP-binding protein